MQAHSYTTPSGRRYNMGYAPAGSRVLAQRLTPRHSTVLQASPSRVGDINSDNADLTMQNQAQTLQANPPSSCIQDGITQNFQVAWNASTPGQASPITVDGKYGPQTAGALANALNYSFTDTNGNLHAAVGGNAPPQVCGGGGGGGGGGGVTPPSPSPTPVNPSQNVTVTGGGSSLAPWIIGGAAVLAVSIGAWAYYEKGHKTRRVVHHYR